MEGHRIYLFMLKFVELHASFVLAAYESVGLKENAEWASARAVVINSGKEGASAKGTNAGLF